jgi:predicted helicase
LLKGNSLTVKHDEFRKCLYRVFVKSDIYYANELNEMRYQTPLMFPNSKSENVLIAVNQGNKPFNIIASKYLVDLHFNGDSQCLPLYRYAENGERIDNITDWGLEHFQTHYKDKKITKEDIFNYTYAVLHNPAYRKKYELNLKREFPRIPFYENFKQWAKWGKKLMDLHINYESVKPFALKEHTHKTKAETARQKEMFERVAEPQALYALQPKNKVKLKADKDAGIIELDELSFLTGIPKEAWEYKLGNRSALEWILDQYKEKKPTDPTIAEKFNTYRFADYKEHVIDLLKRVCTVSVETMKIIREMENLKE